jgi:hypothetical protein
MIMSRGQRGCRRARRKTLPVFILLLPMIMMGLALPARADEAAITAGSGWLFQVRNVDGSWKSVRDASGIRTTAMAVMALGAEAPYQSIEWLLAQTPADLAEAEEAALALDAQLPDAFLAPLVTQRVAVGRWGSASGMAAAPYHTALALVLAKQAGRGLEASEIASAATYLRATQYVNTADPSAVGSWTAGEKGRETASITALCAVSLSMADPVGSVQQIALARQWLLANRNADGGWGKDGSVPSVTAEVLYALRWIGCPVDVESAATAYLVSTQETAAGIGGSWGADPWTTALAVAALRPAGLPDLAFTAGGVSPDPDPIPGDLWNLSAMVINRGSREAVPVAIRLTIIDDQSQEVLTQQLETAGLAPGASTTFSFSIDTASMSGAYTWRLEIDPADLVVEGIESNNSAEGALAVGGTRNLALVPGSQAIFTSDELVQLDAANLPVGTDVKIRASVSCVGDHGAGPVELWVYRGDPALGVLEAIHTVNDFAPGETKTVYVPWKVTTPMGSGTLALVANPRTLVVETSPADNRADLAITVQATDNELPEPPSGVAASVESRTHIDVTWTASSSTDVIGYRIFRDGVPINAVDVAPTAVPSASDSFNLRNYLAPEVRDLAAFDPPHLNDGDPATAWWSIQDPYSEWELEPCFVQFDLPAPKSIRAVVIQWYDFDMGGGDFRIQAWNGTAWSDQATVQGNLLDRSVVDLGAPVVTDKIRILITAGMSEDFVAIREISLLEAGPGRVVTGTSYVDTTLTALPATYTVTAVDAAGNESAHSVPLVLHDTVAPVVAITAPTQDQLVGPEVGILGTVTDLFLQGYSIEYGEGADPAPGAWTRAGQRARPVSNGPIFTWRPPEGFSGTYTIRVTAVDLGGIGNNREARVTVTVDSVPPAEPGGLAATRDGDQVNLTWTANTETDLAGYLVTVNGEAGLVDVSDSATATASASQDGFLGGSVAPSYALDGDPATWWAPPENSYPCWWNASFPAPKSVRKVILKWGDFAARRFSVETLNGSTWMQRWSTDDNTVHVNEIEFSSAVPVEAVRVVIQEGKILGFTGENNPFQPQHPVVPYPMLAEVVFLAEELLPSNHFTTTFLESQEYGMTVTAVDQLGNRSTPSQAEVLDMTGPRVKIYHPFAGGGYTLGRTVVITGEVRDRYLKEYVLHVAPISQPGEEPPAEAWEEIHRSMSEVYWGNLLAVWYPTLRKGLTALRLSATDQAGNRSVTRVDFTVDAMPPEPPANLGATEDAGQVTLQWDASVKDADGSSLPEPIAGYRVYRNEVPLTLSDVAMLARVTAPTLYWENQGDPQNMVDGYVRFDRPGILDNFTWWSPIPFAPLAEIILDLPQPFLLNRVGVDFVNVGQLHLIGKAFTFEIWDQSAGAWVIVADETGNSGSHANYDIAPSVTNRVRLTLKEGWTDYSLGWVSEIHLWREAPGLVAGTAYTDPLPGDAQAAYRITALDGYGNESTKSNRVRIDHTAPLVAITAPVSGELRLPAGSNVAIKGTIEDSMLREYKVELGTGNPTIWTTLREAQGDLTQILTPSWLANWYLPADTEGWYTIRLSAQDEGDRRAETSVEVYIDTRPPDPPAGLTAALEASGVQLDWQASTAGDLAAYHVYRNGKRLDLENIAVNGEAKASSYTLWYDPYLANDGDPTTNWIGLKNQIPAWLRLMFDGFYPVSRVAVNWGPYYYGKDFQLQKWNRATGEWDELASVTDFAAPTYELTFDPPVPLEGFRVHISRDTNEYWMSICEISLYRDPAAPPPTEPHFFDDAIGDPEYSYRVTAVDRFGNESLPSSEFQVDTLNPRVVIDTPLENETVGAHVEITGTVDDRRLLDYRLLVSRGETKPSTWTEPGVTEAGVWERPHRNTVIAVWDPPAGENGVWWLCLKARDISGRETVVERKVVVDTTPPPVPTGLSAAAEAGSSVRLAWTPVAAADFHTYRIYRSGTLLNDPWITPWGQASASVNTETASLAMDGDPKSFWYGYQAPYSWDETFPSGVRVSRVELFWEAKLFIHPPRDYEIQVKVGGEWATVLMVWDNAFVHRVHTIPEPALSSDLRILITGPDHMEGTSWEFMAGITEARFWDESRAVPIEAPLYLDEGLPEIGWNYQVSAVDDLWNESARSAPVMIDTQPPTAAIASPGDNELVKDLVAVRGTVRDTNLKYWRLSVGRGSAPATWEDLAVGTSSRDNAVLATWRPPENFDGEYTLRLHAEDNSGKTADTLVQVRVMTVPPTIPPGLTAEVRGDGAVVLNWSTPSSGQVAGYNVYRNGEKLNRVNIAPMGTAEASSYVNACPGYPASAAIDGMAGTLWAPDIYRFPSWLAVTFPQAYRLQGVSLDWFETLLGQKYYAIDYQVQVWEGGDWKTKIFVENNARVGRADSFGEPLTTTGVRILLTKGVSTEFPGIIDELRIISAELSDLVTGTSFVDSGLPVDPETGLPIAEGVYTVRAVDALGQEGPAAVLIVDNTAPRVSLAYPLDGDTVPRCFTLLGAIADGTLDRVEISWSRENLPAEIIAATLPGADNKIAPVCLPQALLYEGPGTITVRAVDEAANVTLLPIGVSIDTVAPAPPADLTATAVGNSGANLTWTPSAAPDTVGYYVRRGLQTLNPGNMVESAVASASSIWMNSTYRQPWAAIDSLMETGWWSESDEDPKYFEVAFPEPTTVNQFVLWFDNNPMLPPMVPRDFTIEVWQNGAWQVKATEIGYDGWHWYIPYSATFDPPVTTGRIRIHVTRGHYGAVQFGLREVEVYGPGLLGPAVTAYSDTSLQADETAYQVVAMDEIGNIGAPSNTAYIDTASPRVSLTAPLAGSINGVQTHLAGAIQDPNLDRWTLNWGYGASPDSWNTLLQSSAGSFDQFWNTAGIDGEVTLRLQAWDKAGNPAAETSVLAVVDGVPPGTPAGVQAARQPDGILISWNANPEADVVGYRVYRDGAALNGADISHLGRAWASSTSPATDYWGNPANVPGCAIDDSPFSKWVNDTLAVGPVMWGLDFSEPISAEGVNLSFANWPPATVFVEGYRNGGWVILGCISDNVSSYRTVSFSSQTITALRLRFPAAAGVTRAVELAEVEVVSGGLRELVAGLSLLDTFIADSEATEHLWQVAAVDDAQNRSPLSVAALVDTIAPRVTIDAPLDGDLAGARVEITGTIQDPLLESWELEAAVGAQAYAIVASGQAGVSQGLLGVWESAANYSGPGSVRLTARDTSGQVTIVTRSLTVDTVPPGEPSAPAVGAGAEGLQICWAAPASGDAAGYIVYRNGEPIQATDLSRYGAVTAGPGVADPEAARDGQDDTATVKGWHLLDAWWGLEFATPHAIKKLRFTWAGTTGWNRSPQPPTGFTIAVRQGGEWIPVRTVDGETRAVAEYAFDTPVIGDGIRISSSTDVPWKLYDISVIPEETAPLTGTCYRDTTMEAWSPKEAAYRIAAVDEFGNEGNHSGETLFDAVAPRVAILSPPPGSLMPATFDIRGSVADVLLQDWRLDGSLDGGPLQTVASGSSPVSAGLLGAWHPEPGFKGPATLVLSARDRAGNADSTSMTLTVDADPPAPPTGLQAEPGAGSSILTWNASPEVDLAGYRVFKNDRPIGGEISGLAALSTLDGVSLYRVNGGNYWPDVPSGSGFQAEFDYRPEIARIDLAFLPDFYHPLPSTISLEAWDGARWNIAGLILDNSSASVRFPFSTPLTCGKFRVRLEGSGSGNYFLQEISVVAAGPDLLTAVTFTVMGFDIHQDAYTVTALDEAGNESDPSIPAMLDSVAPEAAIYAPAAGSVAGSGTAVVGTAADLFMDHWTLSWGRGADPAEWEVLTAGTASVTNGQLGIWQMPAEEGTATLLLEVWDKVNQKTSARVSLEMDDRAPQAELTLASRYWVPGEPAEVAGTTLDAHLVEAYLTKWPMIGGTTTIVASWSEPRSGLLATLETTGWPEGVTYLELTARDIVNRETHYRTRVDVAPVRFLGEVLLRKASGTPLVPKSASPLGGDLWVIDADGRFHQIGADGMVLSTLPGSVDWYDVGDIEAGADRIWMLNSSELSQFSYQGYPLAAAKTVPGGNAVALRLRSDGTPVVLQTTAVTSFDNVGNLVATIPLTPAPDEAVQDMDIDRFGMIYALGQSGKVFVYGVTGNLFTTISALSASPNPGYGRLRIDPEGRIVLTSRNDGKMITVASAQGTKLSVFGLQGGEPQEIGVVQDIVPLQDRLLVVDYAGKWLEFRPVVADDGVDTALARISFPADGASVNGGVLIAGTAWHDPGTEWVLEAGAGLSPASWTPVGQGTGVLITGTLAPWDTRALAEGWWSLRLTATGGDGLPAVHQIAVKVDNTLPMAQITQPEANQQILGSVTVTGKAFDDEMASYSLTARRMGDSGELLVAQATSPVGSASGDGVLGTWDTAGLAGGVYALSLKVADRSGNVTEAKVTVSLGGVVYLGTLAAGLLGDPVAVTRMPDGRWVVASGGQVRILSTAGEVLKTITADERNYALGEVRDVAATPDGKLAVLSMNYGTGPRLTLFDGEGAPFSGFGELGTLPGKLGSSVKNLVVDRWGRLIVLNNFANSNPGRYPTAYQVFGPGGDFLFGHDGFGDDPGFSRSTTGLGTDDAGNVFVFDQTLGRVQVFDPSANLLEIDPILPPMLDSYTLKTVVGPEGNMLTLRGLPPDAVYLLSSTGAFLAVVGKRGTGEGLLGDPSAIWLGDGLAAVGDRQNDSLVVYDVSSFTGAVDLLTAEIHSPAAGGLVPRRFRVQGRAVGPGTTGYRILAGAGTAPGEWTEVASGTRPIAGGDLGAVDLGTLPDGDVTLRLVVSASGTEIETRATYLLDGTPPTAEIVEPAPLALLQDGEPVVIRLTDAAAGYTLFMGRDDQASGSRTILAQGTGSVDGRRVDWNPASFPHGVYRLTLIAEDAAGNRSRQSFLVSTGTVRYAGEWPVSGLASESLKRLVRDGDTLLVLTNLGLHRFDGQGNRIETLFSQATNGVVPLDVAVFADGYVIQTNSYWPFSIYSRTGQFVRRFGSQNDIPWHAWFGLSLRHVDDNGVLYVSSPDNRYYLYRYTSQGQMLPRIDNYTVAEGDSFGNLYLSGPGRLDMCAASGEPIHSFGGNSANPEVLTHPASLSLDGAGHILVQEGWFFNPGNLNHYELKANLSWWAADGRCLAYTAGPGSAEGWFDSASEAVAGPDGRALVLTSTGKVWVFDPAAALPAPSTATAQIVTPADGSYQPGVFNVVGTAAGGDTYTLSVEGDGVNMTVSSGQAAIVDGLLGTVHCSGLDEGGYTLVLRVTRAGSSSEEHRHSFTVDRTNPVAEIQVPANYGGVNTPTDVLGRVGDANLVRWTLDMSSYALARQVIAQGNTVVDGVLAHLDPAALTPATYTLRLAAVDAAGHETVVESIFSVGTFAIDLVVNIPLGTPGYYNQASGLAILPDGTLVSFGNNELIHRAVDGTYLGVFAWEAPITGLSVLKMTPTADGLALLCMDSTTYYVVFLDCDGSRKSWFTVPGGIVAGALLGIPVGFHVAPDRVLFMESTHVESYSLDGSYIGTWGEKGSDPGEFNDIRLSTVDRFGRVLILDMGQQYQTRVQIFSLDGTHRGQFKLDVRNEAGNYVSPAHIAADSLGNFAFMANSYRGYYLRPDGRLLGQFGKAWGSSPGAFMVPIGIGFDANDRLWVFDRDSYTDCPFRLQLMSIDRERLATGDPDVALLIPEEGSLVSAETWIQGRVTGTVPLSWDLTAGEGSDPTSWWAVAEGNGRFPVGIFATWRSGGRPDGSYTLRLRVSDGTGPVTEVRRHAILDATPPTVRIDEPAAASLPQQAMDLTGEITDGHPADFGVKYYGQDQVWWILDAGDPYPAGPFLGAWRAEMLGTDTYRLKAWAQDGAGNLSVANRDVSIQPLGYLGASVVRPPSTSAMVYAASRDGRQAFLSPDNSKVIILGEDFGLLREISLVSYGGWSGSPVNQMAFSLDGDLLLYGFNPNRMLRYSSSGELTGDYLIPTAGPGTFSGAKAMLALPGGRVAFLLANGSASAGSIKIHSFEEGFVGSFDIPAAGSGASAFATSLAFDRLGRILLPCAYLAGNGYFILAYSQEGELLETIPLNGWQGADGFLGFTVDGGGSFFVRRNATRVEKYSSQGDFLSRFGSLGPYPGRVMPVYYYEGIVTIAAGRGGRIYTVEPYVGRINAYELLDATVDNEAPSVSLDPALALLPLREVEDIRGTVQDAQLYSWTLKALPGGSVAGAILLASGDSALADSTLASWDTTGHDGEWLLVFEARDFSGNASRAELPVTVQQLAAPSLDAPATPVNTPLITVSGQGLAGATAHVSLNGVESFQVMVDGADRFSVQVGPLAEGANVISARLGDERGHAGPPSGPVSVVADYTAPVTAITVGDPKIPGTVLYVRPATVFSLSAADAGSGILSTHYRIDGGAWTAYAPFGVTGEGVHVIEYRSLDNAGNNEVPGSLTVALDTLPPLLSVDPPADPYRLTDCAISGSRETGAVVALAVDTAAVIGPVTYPTTGTWSCDVTGMVEGYHQFTATASDEAGNSSTAQGTVHVVFNRPPVLDAVGDQAVNENEQLTFAVSASDPDGTTPVIIAATLPPGAAFDGAVFAWRPTHEQAGSYQLTFTAGDGELTAVESVAITVFNVNRVPGVPTVSAPRTGNESTERQPSLSIENSLDPDGDLLVYVFEVYADAGYTVLLDSAVIPEGTPLTAWALPGLLADNAWVWWRVKAGDGQAFSQWATGNFFVNTVNDPPGPFTASWPQDGLEVDTMTPLLRVDNSFDVDADPLTYAFFICDDPGLNNQVASAEGQVPGQGTTGWTVNPPLSENTWYFWRATVTDEHEAQSSAGPFSFFVNTFNDAPGMPTVYAPPSNQEIDSLSVDLTVDNSADLDHDTLSYWFELDSVATYDGPGKVASPAVPEGPDRTTWSLTGLADNTRYWWRVKAYDGLADSPWVTESFFVNLANDAPSQPSIKNPGADAWVTTLSPLLEVYPAGDVDGDTLSYSFEVYAQPMPTGATAFGTSATTGWTVSPALTDNTWYWWRARAEDGHGLTGAWTELSACFVNDNGFNDPPAITLIEPSRAYLAATGGTLTISWDDADPDSAAVVSLYRDDGNSGLDGVLIAGSIQEDPEGTGDSYLWDLSGVPVGTYYVYGVISDGSSSRSSYGLGMVTIDDQAPVTTVNPGTGTYANSVTVTLTALDNQDPNPVIRYTTDGSTPDPSSPIYAASLVFTQTTTLKYFATDSVGLMESPKTAVHTITTGFTINATAGVNGTITPSGVVMVQPNASQTFSLVPNGNHKIATLTVDGASVTPNDTYTFSDVTANHTISVTFSLCTVVTLVDPNGGQVLPTGSPFVIRFGGPSTAVKYKLEYTTNGTSWTNINSGATGYTYNWTVPKLTANSTTCKIRATGLTAGGSSVGVDTSDANFAIEVVRLTTPNGGETINRGTVTPITWVTNGTAATVNKVVLSYSTNSGSNWTTIVTLTTNPGTYSWTVPTSINSSSCRVRVQLYRNSASQGLDASNANFSITP